ncbi:hypothetical protein LSUB1_G000476 [Lachnellula subtilissima]|uniref:BTB domain-containing protein n=1 Tax=Lachnellula subtilissima TaxID=602034 RepID=A0A8H8UIZ2_9HELO|nr:hypothetical protein LSUB1_G000476 [Lachnellula subtilissima]
MNPGQKGKATKDSPPVPEASKRVQRSESERGSRPSFLDATEIVKINIFERGVNSTEATKRTFPVHEAILCHYYPFFDAAFNGRFEAGTTQELDLPNANPITFSIFVEWVYSQEVTMSLPKMSNDILRL